jgi:hypothetical protein
MRPISVTLPNALLPGPAPITSAPIRLDEFADPPCAVQVVVTGTVTFTVQGCFDEGPDSLVNPIPVASMGWDNGLALQIPTGAVAGTASIAFPLPVTPLWLRIQLNTGTGSVRMNVVQYNVTNA